jgi:hypothetical protein
MISLYTAVGRIERRVDENGQYPVVMVNNKEHIVDISEMIVWTCCNWRILDLPGVGKLFRQLARDAGADESVGFEIYTERLLRRGLIVKGVGDDSAGALYDLLNSLYIIPVTSGLFVKIAAFLKFTFVNRMPLSRAKIVFRRESLTDEEMRVVNLARQTQLSTAELIKCVETGVYDLSSESKVMAVLYDDDVTTCDNIGSYAKLFHQQRHVLETVANLYLRKLIIFERL